MKKSKAETAETRKRIIETAATQFRRNGIHATGVADMMAAAGLTHGGFYRHFASKGELVSEACAESTKAFVHALEALAGQDGGEDGLKTLVERYLSPEHRDDPSGGCPLVSIGSELARTDADTRKAASEGFIDLVDAIASHIQPSPPDVARAQALFTLCAMIGALTMSRIVDDPELSTAILDGAKVRLLQT